LSSEHDKILIMSEFTLGQIKEIILHNIFDQLTDVTQFRILMAGPPGIGKTSMIQSIADELNQHGVRTYLVTASGTEPYEYWTGLPYLDQEHNQAKFSTPYVIAKASKLAEETIVDEVEYIKWKTKASVEKEKFLQLDIDTLIKDPKAFADFVQAEFERSEKQKVTTIFDKIKAILRGKPLVILFIDDIHTATPAIQRYLFTLLQSKSIHGYRLPDNVVIIAAGNISSEAGFEGILSPVINRLAIFRVKLPLEEWLELDIVKNNVHSLIKSFLQANPIYFTEQESNEEPFGSPRSWTELGKTLKRLQEDLTAEYGPKGYEMFIEIAMQLPSGYVSREASNKFRAYIQIFKEINIAEILAKRQLIEIYNKVKNAELVSGHKLNMLEFGFIANEVTLLCKSQDDYDHVIDLVQRLVNDEEFTLTSQLVTTILESASKNKQLREKIITKLLPIITVSDRVKITLLHLFKQRL